MSRFPSGRLAALAAALLVSACYRVTVISGPVPAEATAVVDKPWNHSFILGLVPPAPVDVSRPCGGRVSQVVTQHSFLNGLVANLTFGVYTPIQVTVTCAGPRAASLGAPANPLAAALGAEVATAEQAALPATPATAPAMAPAPTAPAAQP